MSGRRRRLGGQLAAEALANLYAVRQRSLLALIGIIIGTAAIIAMINVGHNAGAESVRQFKSMGTDILVVQSGMTPDGRESMASLADALGLPAILPAVETAAPVIISGSRVTARGRGVDAPVVGATAELAKVARLPLHAGRFITDFDRFETFAVAGSAAAAALGTPQRPLRVGDQIRIGDYMITIVGVLDEVTPNLLIPVAFNDAIIMPLGSMRRILPDPKLTNIVVRVGPQADPIAVGAEITAYFQAKLHGSPLQVQTARQLIAGMRQQAQVFTYLLAAIGSISLIVGGVGVMNVMLMGVVERRREIGLRMAIGARRGDIRLMFLFEATVLSLAGGLAGTMLGLAAAYAFAQMSQWQFVLSAMALPLGAGVSGAVGLFFGLYPAVTAARLDPIAALRSE